MLFSLLADDNGNAWISYVLIGVLVVILIGSMILMNRRSKKREKEAQDLIDAVKPGNKVTTIGGIAGIVVEVNSEDNTFVLETGSEDHGKCFIKFIRQAIYESDAVVDKNDKKDEKDAKDEKVEETTEAVPEAVGEAPAEEQTETAPVAEGDTSAADENAVAEEAPVEEAPAEEAKPKKKSSKKQK